MLAEKMAHFKREMVRSFGQADRLQATLKPGGAAFAPSALALTGGYSRPGAWASAPDAGLVKHLSRRGKSGYHRGSFAAFLVAQRGRRG
jgi:hypothetical protein